MIFSAALGFFFTFSLLLANLPSIHVHARPLPRHNRKTVVHRDLISSGLTSASWIWARNGSSTSGNVAFIKSFSTPAGKIASNAVITMTAVEHATLWCNGHPIGVSGTGQDGWKSAHVLRAALNASVNTFSVLVSNSNSTTTPPGFVAAIQVSYNDSTTSSLMSDSSWLAASESDIPADFPTPSDLSRFASAVAVASYGSGPWGQNVALALSDSSPPTLQDSTWIWSTPNASQGAPVGTVGFRKAFPTPGGKSAQSATILLTVDNTFTLYLNGNYIGSPPADPNAVGFISVWSHPQQFTVTLNSTLNVFDVIAQNFPAEGNTDDTSAGFIATIQIRYTDGTSDTIHSDSSWLTGDATSAPTFLSTSDANLSPSIAQGPLGTAPWGSGLLSISDALNADSVPAAPLWGSGTSTPPATSSTSPSSHSHSIPVVAIVAPIAGVLVVGAIIAFFVWRLRSATKTRGLPGVTPFLRFSRYAVVPTDPSASEAHSSTNMVGTTHDDAPPPSYSVGELDPLVAGLSGGPPRRKQRR
ncbi:hypothetical protein DFH06DRAFT_266082 [Mycena polygramma]|nr:hypothetical protein DFH06DRAFT_266082 [Mycena polygramma]